MKIIIAFAALLAVAAAAPSYHGSGQPGCQLEAEFSPSNLWRNNWDNTAYWECVTVGEPGEGRRCENRGDGSLRAFHPILLECVDHADWEWIAPTPPLSEPQL